ncbi:3-hydroxyacyl-CoA dehydrogenase family protein [Sporosarcina sp. P29]|uniref:3-hydroxyacyl-CoA dehydrogenase family protein n=1 Tax=Sporosarcina sp. P29 TaxID=2048252 RepID=UPI000C1727C0|nr:3-hydroxyacyl-CoA dehydrogenase family protein [Sporosarcina sp. P29]PID00866.1 3-hydroxyacyl-CoA dehydrogenase [Sporosarcina sp. P29]
MNSNDVKRITVIGAGQMGHQIAMLCALGGYQTTLQDINQEALQQAKNNLERLMSDWVRKGKINEPAVEKAFSLLTFTDQLEEAAKDADLVIEAIVEVLEAKQELFKKLDEITPPHAILATNSSTIMNSLIAEVTDRPDKVCNMHFFFPPLVMDSLEVVMSEKTSEETKDIAMAVSKQIGRTAVLLRKEISGFVANRILGAIHREATYLYEEGIADFKDIDLIIRKSLGHKLGPFQLIDMSGADVVYSAMQHQYQQSGDERDKPPACIKEKVDKGELGRKTKIGFYDYREVPVK